MKREHNSHEIDLAGRLKDLEHFTGTPVARREAEPDAVPINEAPSTRVPVPRRSRVFLRHGAGHGVFAELTLTAPRPALD
ncbi:hypothetical protein SAMN05192575_101963 [Nocardioides alpinus]|uniref:Uncharacterized protein n=1 Tax=Nocardioides alpinus TaxID=748909 RepID=A0A1I0WF21_9ACTN|nr:hypothetical protein [Nocardioides alpinus]PKH37891.1 hypothetical protein CXG46_21135 [Nocardioides alpinus]SFA87359.1 hypothetical protein SAMN05192575_101963 [Nocardioides alpinus]